MFALGPPASAEHFFEVDPAEAVFKTAGHFDVAELRVHRKVLCHHLVRIEMNGFEPSISGGILTKRDERSPDPMPCCLRKDGNILKKHMNVCGVKDDEALKRALIIRHNEGVSCSDLGGIVRDHRCRDPADPLNIPGICLHSAFPDLHFISSRSLPDHLALSS